MALDYMLKHRGFPGRLPGTDFQFTLRRANPKGATPIERRERRSMTASLRIAARMRALSLRCGKISGINRLSGAILMRAGSAWLFGREVICPATDPFDPADYEAQVGLRSYARPSHGVS